MVTTAEDLLQLSPEIERKVGNAILISGSGRSGTTIMGKLLHSFKCVEYVFEPAMLVSLMPMIDRLDASSWKLLYETYLYEEFLMNALSGRAINTNAADDSSIYKVKSTEEIEAKLIRSIRKAEAVQMAQNAMIAYKLPNIVPFIPRLVTYYPHKRVLIMKRDAASTIHSLLEKGWFSEESVRTSAVWPYRLCDDVHVPSWIRSGDEELWVTMTEIDRCAYYYIRVSEDVRNIPNRLEIRYSDLLNNPKAVAHQIAETYHLEAGPKTAEIIASIRPIAHERDPKVLNSISSTLSEKVYQYSAET